MATAATFPRSIAVPKWIMDALQAVSHLEQGEVVHDHVNLDEYVARRVHYLGQLNGFKLIRNGLFAIARADAAVVFRTELEPEGDQLLRLSIEEVRRLEIARAVLPILPLRTTHNTETIDNFGEYGAGEWPVPHRGVNSRNITSTPTSSLQLTNKGTEAGLAEQTPSTYNSSPSHLSSSIPSTSPADLSALATSPPSQDRASSMASSPPPADSTGRFANEDDMMQFVLANLGAVPRVILPPAETQGIKSEGDATQPQTSTADVIHSLEDGSKVASTPEPTADRVEVAGPTSSPAPSLSLETTTALATLASPQPMGLTTAASALTRRGIHVPIKLPRGKKRPRATEADEDVTVAAAALSEAEDIGSSEGRPQKKRKGIVHSSSQKSRATAIPASPLAAVIAGTALPRSRQAAVAASAARLAALQAAAATTGGAAPLSLDFPPEFFDNRNLTTNMETGVTRCICGADDTHEEFVSCDECYVWQHEACMGAAVPQDTENGAYRCQVCDPWAHRRLIAVLRQTQQ